MKNLAYGKVGSCFALVVSKHTFSDAEWDGYLTFLRENLMPGIEPKTIVMSQGASPTAMQRRKLNELTAPYADKSKIAVVTESPIVRGVVAALSWFNPFYRAFPPQDLDRALAFLGISGGPAAEVKLMIEMLLQEIHHG